MIILVPALTVYHAHQPARNRCELGQVPPPREQSTLHLHPPRSLHYMVVYLQTREFYYYNAEIASQQRLGAYFVASKCRTGKS